MTPFLLCPCSIARWEGRTEITDLIPIPHAVILLEQTLVMRDAVLAVDPAVGRRRKVSCEDAGWLLRYGEGEMGLWGRASGWMEVGDLPWHC